MSQSSSNIRIELSRKKWEAFSALLSEIATKSPIECWEVESCLLAEYYQRNIRQLNYFICTKSGKTRMSMRPSEAYALYFMLLSGDYTKDSTYPYVFIIEIQKQLPAIQP